MHVVFICAEYPVNGRPTGGFGTYVRTVSDLLAEKGIEVSIICQGDKEESMHFRDKKIYVLPQLTSISNTYLINTRLRRFLNYPLGFSWQVSNKLRQLEKKEQIDVVEGGDFGGELFFYLLKRRKRMSAIIIKLHTPSFIIRKYNNEPLTIFYRILKFIEQYVLRNADAIHSPTYNLAKEVNLKASKIIPYPLPSIDIKRIEKQNSQLILYVGKIQRKKGLYILVKAFKKLVQEFPSLKLYCIGPDTLEHGMSTKEQLLMTIPKKIRSQVFFIRSLPQSELYRYYQQAIVTVVPSIWDNYPNVILEAIQSGSVVVSTNTGGIPEMLKHEVDSLLVPPGNSTKLAEAIRKLLKNTRVREKLLSNAQQKLRHKLNPDKITLDTINFYLQICRETTEVKAAL